MVPVAERMSRLLWQPPARRVSATSISGASPARSISVSAARSGSMSARWQVTGPIIGSGVVTRCSASQAGSVATTSSTARPRVLRRMRSSPRRAFSSAVGSTSSTLGERHDRRTSLGPTSCSASAARRSRSPPHSSTRQGRSRPRRRARRERDHDLAPRGSDVVDHCTDRHVLHARRVVPGDDREMVTGGHPAQAGRGAAEHGPAATQHRRGIGAQQLRRGLGGDRHERHRRDPVGQPAPGFVDHLDGALVQHGGISARRRCSRAQPGDESRVSPSRAPTARLRGWPGQVVGGPAVTSTVGAGATWTVRPSWSVGSLDAGVAPLPAAEEQPARASDATATASAIASPRGARVAASPARRIGPVSPEPPPLRSHLVRSPAGRPRLVRDARHWPTIRTWWSSPGSR